MRKTWISEIRKNPVWNNEVQIFFIIAISRNDTKKIAEICEELSINSDILLLDVIDAYELHTVKMLAFMEYFLTKCSTQINYQRSKGIPILIKLTDDVIIFEHSFISALHWLINSNYSERFVAGLIAKAHYVNYSTGCTYLISYKSVKEIYDFARCLTELSFVDDVLLAGTIPTILKIPKINIPSHSFYDKMPNEVKNSPQLLSQLSFLHNYQFNSKAQQQIWENVNNFEIRKKRKNHAMQYLPANISCYHYKIFD